MLIVKCSVNYRISREILNRCNSLSSIFDVSVLQWRPMSKVNLLHRWLAWVNPSICLSLTKNEPQHNNNDNCIGIEYNSQANHITFLYNICRQKLNTSVIYLHINFIHFYVLTLKCNSSTFNRSRYYHCVHKFQLCSSKILYVLRCTSTFYYSTWSFAERTLFINGTWQMTVTAIKTRAWHGVPRRCERRNFKQHISSG